MENTKQKGKGRLAGRLLNPKLEKLVNTYKNWLSEFITRNPFIGNLIEKVRQAYSMQRGRFGYHDGRILMRGFVESGAIDIVTDQDKLNERSDAFFMVADTFKDMPERDEGRRGMYVLSFFYRYLYRKGLLDERFLFREKSPKTLLRRGRLYEFLQNEYEGWDSTCIIEQRRNYPVIFTLNLRAPFLKDYAVRALSHSRDSWRQNRAGIEIGRQITIWYDAQGEPLNDYRDMTGARLSAAVDHILKTYTTHYDIAQAMYFIFDLYQAAILEHPKHDFFADSHVWNSIIVMDQKLPMSVAAGYKMVLPGQTENLPGYEKVVFCLTDSRTIYANDHRFGIRSVDLSRIKSEFYRRIVVNFIAANRYTGFDRTCELFSYLEKRKNGKNLDHIDKHDLNGYRRHICGLKGRKGERITADPKNCYIRNAKKILQWAEDKDYLHIEKDAWNDFDIFKTIYRPMPKPLPKEYLLKVKAGLTELAKTDYRAQLALWVFEIQLFGDTRAGEICKTDITKLRYRPSTGTFESVSVEKNSFMDVVEVRYSAHQTRILEDIIETTAKLRATCPIDGPENNLFVYNCGKYRNNEFKVMTTTSYDAFLEKACNLMGIDRFTSGNVRDTYYTAVRRHTRANGLTDLQESVLTHHRNKVSTNSYVDVELDLFLELGNAINIGRLKRRQTKNDNKQE